MGLRSRRHQHRGRAGQQLEIRVLVAEGGRWGGCRGQSASQPAARVLTALGVGIPVLWPDAAHDVGQVYSRPGEGHAVAAQPGAELLGGQAQLLQLLFVLWGDAPAPQLSGLHRGRTLVLHPQDLRSHPVRLTHTLPSLCPPPSSPYRVRSTR